MNYLIGIIIFGVTMICITLFTKYYDKERDKDMMKIMVTIVCTIVFFCSSMMMTSTYSLLTLIITENDFNMILFPLLIVVFWIIENKVYTYLSNGADIMSIEDKKLCHFVSLICLCIIGLYYNCHLKTGYFISCISISIGIGAYVSIDDIYKNMSIRGFYNKNIDFLGKVNSTVKKTIFPVAIVFCLCCIVEKMNEMLGNIALGFAIGATILIVVVSVYVFGRKGDTR